MQIHTESQQTSLNFHLPAMPQVQNAYLTIARLHDKDHRELGLNENPLLKIKTLDQNSLDTVLKQFADVEIAVGCDVDAPLYGEKGAAVMFARQKGAQDDQIVFLDNQLQLVAKLLKRDLKQPYYGAGGGIAAALSLFATSVSSGFTLLNTYLHIEDSMKDMDLVITGEGRMDEQSLQGKLPVCIASIAKQMQVPVIAVCGQKKGEVSSFDTYFNGVFSIQPADEAYGELEYLSEDDFDDRMDNGHGDSE